MFFSISEYMTTKNMLAVINDDKQDTFEAVTYNIVHRIDENNEEK